MVRRSNRRTPANPPATFRQAPSPVPRGAPQARVDASRTGGVPESRRTSLRGAVGAGTGLGLGLAGAGIGIGLAEGLPGAFGGQGPFASALNPDKQAGTPGGPPQSVLDSLVGGSPMTVLFVGALIFAGIYFLNQS